MSRSPRNAPPATSQTAFILNRRLATAESIKITTDGHPVSTLVPNRMVTTSIRPTALIFTASRNAPMSVDLRRRGIRGFKILTNTKDGRNIAAVAITPPCQPSRNTPMNVAVVRTGPGVNWPIAIASSSCCSVSHP